MTEPAVQQHGRRLNVEDAANRVSAYVYGNIVALGTLSGLTWSEAITPKGLVIVGGVSIATFLTHAFANSIGFRMRSGRRLTWADTKRELRDSVPIVSSAIVPLLALVIAAMTRLPPVYAQLVAAIYLVIRLALVGALVARLQGHRSSWRIVAAGILLALVGAGLTAFKVFVSH